MKRALAMILLVVKLVLFSSCTSNEMVRQYGGKEDYTLKQNEVLLNVTWKELNMWVLTVDTTTGIKYFREKSAYGVYEGEITFK